MLNPSSGRQGIYLSLEVNSDDLTSPEGWAESSREPRTGQTLGINASRLPKHAEFHVRLSAWLIPTTNIHILSSQ
jgi:hypothetical protein